MRRRRRIVMIGVIAFVAALSFMDHAGVFGYRGDDRSRYEDVTCIVTYAVDGDTIDVDLPDGGRPVTRIRLWGVDCPEMAHGDGEEDDYFGREARDFVRNEVVGRKVRLAFDPNRGSRDRFGRLLAYVELVDSGEMLNELVIRRGLGYADPRFDHVLKHRFVQLDQKAMKAGVGLWAGVTAERMPAWRQRLEAKRP